MFKYLAVFFSLLSSVRVSAQDLSTDYYNRGVVAFQTLQFAKADSLYTLSLRISPSTDGYFNRAMARLKLDNKKGYFEDLLAASILGDKESTDMFKMQTVTIDTLRVATSIVSGKLDSTVVHSHYVIYRFLNMEEELELKYNSRNGLINVSWSQKQIIPDSSISEQAEYRGGLKAMTYFINKNMIYPDDAKKNAVSGKAFLKFVINSKGCVERILVLKGVENFQSLDNEAVRLLTLMPRWKPASVKGKPVKTFYTLPFTFKIQ